jgi:hypothetical protein
VLVAARIGQGHAAALLMPQALAVLGVILYGAIKHSLPHAFELSLAELAAVSLAVAACSRLLPRRAQG